MRAWSASIKEMLAQQNGFEMDMIGCMIDALRSGKKNESPP